MRKSCLVGQTAEIQLDPVVAVDEHDPFALRAVQPRISCCRQPGVLLMDDAHSCVLRGIAVTDRTAFVGRAVINQYDFNLAHTLIEKTVDTALQIRVYPIDRHNNTDKRHAKPLL